jgi:integrase
MYILPQNRMHGSRLAFQRDNPAFPSSVPNQTPDARSSRCCGNPQGGKGGHIRTIPVPQWVKEGVDNWTVGDGITSGPLLRSINKAGRIWGHGFTLKLIWAIVKANAKSCGLPSVAPHDLRRTCARLCHQAGGELDHIQFLLGHVSIQTTERYLGCKQRFNDAVNDLIGLVPDAPS